jgi:hypothetical protein
VRADPTLSVNSPHDCTVTIPLATALVVEVPDLVAVVNVDEAVLEVTDATKTEPELVPEALAEAEAGLDLEAVDELDPEEVVVLPAPEPALDTELVPDDVVEVVAEFDVEPD